MTQTALLSVSDKTGLTLFAQGLVAAGYSLLASGGTAATLQQAGLPVEEIAEYTESAEILGGRVKTLHPRVHGGILARNAAADEQDLNKIGGRMIDLVAVNLYPFQQTVAKPGVSLAEAIEQIDIGGVALIRAAAKNHNRVTVVCDPADYPRILEAIHNHGETPAGLRSELAVKAFGHTARYDAAITTYLEGSTGSPQASSAPLHVTLFPVQELRYGENPHQQAMVYSYVDGGGPLGGRLLQGKPLSYNNLLDLDAAWRAVIGFDQPSVVIVKHLSPCGIASAENLVDAFRAALASDPVSAFGGVIAINRALDAGLVEAIGDLFVECIAAPQVTEGGQQQIARKKNLRLLEIPSLEVTPTLEFRSINTGMLVQQIDLGDPQGAEEAYQVVSQRAPTEAEWQSLRFAWRACQHVKSNAIVLAQGQATVGIGGGQPNRVDCVRIAVTRAGEKAAGSVMASDAFFPFPDGVEEAAAAGVSAVIQPGGSVRDQTVIDAANQHGMAMVFTGVRHFRH